jgi:hypothetical protein
LAEGVVEGVEELEKIVAGPFAVAAASDADGDEDAGGLEAVEGGAGGGGGDRAAVRGAVRAHDGVAGEAHG